MSKGNNLQSLFCGILFCISISALVIAYLAFTKKGGGKDEYYETPKAPGTIECKPVGSGLYAGSGHPHGPLTAAQCKTHYNDYVECMKDAGDKAKAKETCRKNMEKEGIKMCSAKTNCTAPGPSSFYPPNSSAGAIPISCDGGGQFPNCDHGLPSPGPPARPGGEDGSPGNCASGAAAPTEYPHGTVQYKGAGYIPACLSKPFQYPYIDPPSCSCW